MPDRQAIRDAGVVIWGGTGFIGRHLADALLRLGARVSIVSRHRKDEDHHFAGGPVDWYHLSSASPAETWREALVEAEVVFNLAGASGAESSNARPFESLDGNCRMQLEFLDACTTAPRVPHVVFASSRLVYGRTGTASVDESWPVAPRSLYAAHKICVEHYHHIYSLRRAITATICRISNPYGPDTGARAKGYGVINSLILQAHAGEPLRLYGGGHQLRDYLFVDDLVDALLLCGFKPEARNETFNIGSGCSISLAEAARQIQSMTGARILSVPWPASAEMVESGDYRADVTKAAMLLGFSCRRSFQAGLQKTLESHRELVEPPV